MWSKFRLRTLKRSGKLNVTFEFQLLDVNLKLSNLLQFMKTLFFEYLIFECVVVE